MNPNLALFAQQVAPQAVLQRMPPQGQPMPQGIPAQAAMPPRPQMPQGASQMPPQAPQAAAQPMARPQHRFTPAELAALGRYGDTLIAHLTPGEIQVPPQVQTPKLRDELGKAFTKSHVPMQAFVAGSPQSNVNPQTGIPEYNFWSSFLPAVLGIAGGFLAPEIFGPADAAAASGGAAAGSGAAAAGSGTAADAVTAGLDSQIAATDATINGIGGGAASGAAATTAASGMSPALLKAAGTGIGTALGTKITGGSTQDALLAGLGSGAGGYYGGKWLPDMNIGPVNLGSTIGSLAGGALMNPGTPSTSNTQNLPPGFNTPMTPISQLPNSSTLLGNNRQVTPSFQNYNPYLSATVSPYNFYPAA